jgi:hypothetical protein
VIKRENNWPSSRFQFPFKKNATFLSKNNCTRKRAVVEFFFAKIRRLKIERKFCLLKKNLCHFRKCSEFPRLAGWFVCNSSSKNAAKICGSPVKKNFCENFENSEKFVFLGADGNAVWSAFEGLAQLGPDVARRNVAGEMLRRLSGRGGARRIAAGRGGGGGREVTSVHCRLLPPVVLVGVLVPGAFLLFLVLLLNHALEQPLEGVDLLIFLVENVF